MYTILIVDDSRTFRRLLVQALEPEGYDVIEVESGLQALKLLADTTPNLIISDLHMADMSGIEFIKHVRAAPALIDLPVLILTTEQDNSYRELARRAGASAWYEKPFQETALQDAVRSLLSR